MRFCTIFITFALCLLANVSIASARWDMVLLTTSGLNGQLLPAREKKENNGMVRTFGGFARIESVLDLYRTKYPGCCLTVATGDDLMGESLTNEQGKTVFGTMNRMGFDASTLGNHEFDRGTNFLIKCLKNKKFPTIVSNIEVAKGNPLGKYIMPYTVMKVNYLNVGIMGMILPSINMISNPGPGISIKTDLIETARKTAEKLKESGADVIVLLSHLTLEDQKKILEQVPEIDIICGGQSHKDILPGQEIIARDALTPGLMVQCGNQGRYVGVLKVRIKDGTITKHEWTMIPVSDQTKADPKILDYITSQVGDSDADETIAVSSVPLDTRVGLIRTREAPIGMLVSSIMQKRFKTDIAFQNSGGIRGDKLIPAGKIPGLEINRMFPFGNTITILKITGKELKQVLERSVYKLPDPSGAFLQISGVRYTLDLSGTPQELEINAIGKPVRVKTPGSRVSKIRVMDITGTYRPIREKDKYSVTTNSFLAKGGDGYIMLKDAPGKVETFIRVRDVIKFGLLDMNRIKIRNTPVMFNKQGMPYYN
ncbi:bifunctional UDP-sugar hydrolase/5'-nucleotidase [Maridesulfovibrio sp.]|uniref:bifunctional metallophosphatase/5'-nucleotidase n=1 Tax=Maridesulfovibrio sp. TaxID=2795000 RepID=UPI002A1877E3|nr:bifunctional UDP-sugar hydrolase/5'-nucleotidase [Maridesulfovibrio sp.]